jgi:Ca2+-transporting ATPase
MNWWNKDLKFLEEELKTDLKNGLTEKEAKKRAESFGLNEIPEEKQESFFKIFIDQFKSPLIYILLFASVLVLFLGDIKDSLMILFVLLFNAFIGSFQEIKAQKALLALKNFIETDCVVLREGKEIIINSKEVVPGDILILREGEKVAADARIIEANNLKVNESALTGESLPVLKHENLINEENLPIQKQHNMLFMGSVVVSGIGKACVVSSGVNSFLGQISQKILKIDTEIPLKKEVRAFSRVLLLIVFVLVLLLFSIGILKGRGFFEMFKIVVALSVSIVPAGLPILLTVVLSLGVWEMAKKNALVKKLQAVESLGQVKIIAVDKTGTLTKNELTIKKIFINNNFFEITGNGYDPKGFIKLNNQIIDFNNFPELILAAKIAAFCSNATINFLEDKKIWQVLGDPIEASFYVFAQKLGIKKEELEKENPQTAEIPFDYKTKYHATFHKINNKNFITAVGAPEKILDLCDKIYLNNKFKKITAKDKENILKILDKMAEEGLRVVAFAYKETKDKNLEIKNLIFGGFYGIEDSLREEVPDAMLKVKSAGIKIVMITGDHRLTALAIAKQAKISEGPLNVLTGEEIDNMNEDALSQAVLDTNVFARVTPEHKLKIIEAYRKNGQIVAMTGDGVNDAPPLVAADLGVAMGKIGTEVAKEASDIILLDDNFGTIVDAIEEGRVIYKNIQKIILFLISTSLGELLSISFAVILGMPNLILPSQILWLNLVTDPFMGIGLAFEKKEGDILKQNFNRSKYLIDKLMFLRMFLMAGAMTFGGLYVFSLIYEFDLKKAQTMTLLVLAIFQWFNALNCRFEYESAFKNIFSNKILWLSLGSVFILQMLAIYNPLFQKILDTRSLSFDDWIFAISVAFLIIIVEEARKFFARIIKGKNV